MSYQRPLDHEVNILQHALIFPLVSTYDETPNGRSESRNNTKHAEVRPEPVGAVIQATSNTITSS